MATQLKSLKIDRVDLVPEGANSAAFVTLYKGKEGKSMEAEEILAKMRPEHAAVIQAKLEALEKEKKTAEEEAADAKADAENAKADAKAANQRADEAEEAAKKTKDSKAAEDVDKNSQTVSFDEDETLLKALPEELQEYVGTIKKQKEAAEKVAKEAIEHQRHSEAIAKAADLKALPVENDTLVAFIEKAAPETVEMLETIAKAIDTTVLNEQGSNEAGSFSKSANNAWDALEAKAQEIAKSRDVTVAKGMSIAIDENPELYREYLEGGAN